MDSLEAIIEEMALHTQENPTHGYNCACKDVYLRRARSLLADRGLAFIAEFWYLCDAIRMNPPR